MKEKLEILERKRSEIKKAKDDIVKYSSDLFDEFREYIFEKYPQIDSFGWTQYTPYFNDGDTCRFSAHTDYIKINDEYSDESNWINPTNIVSYGNWDRDKKEYVGRVEEENKNYNPELASASEEIIKFLSKFDNDFYLAKFGDHAEVTVTKDKVDISDCDHE